MKYVTTLKLLLVAAATLLTLGCEHNPDVEQKPDDGTLSLTFDVESIDIDPLGGDYAVDYTLRNGLNNINPVAQSVVGWIHDMRADADKIYFTVDANPLTEARATKIELKYPGLETLVLLDVRQAAVGEQLLDIELKESKASECTTLITPKDDTLTYIAYGSSVSYFLENSITTAEELFADDYAYFDSLAAEYDTNLGEFMTLNSLVHTGAKSILWEGLSLGEPYVVYAYGVRFNDDTTAYTLATPVYHIIVTPTADSMLHVDFDMQFDIHGAQVTHTVAPKQWDAAYYYEYFPEGNQYFRPATEPITDAYIGSVISDWKLFMDAYLNFGYTGEQIMDMACYTGVFTKTETLLANTTYMAQAYAIELVDGVPQVASVPVIEYFTTGNVERSDMNIDIAVENCYVRVADITTTPSNDQEPYHVYLTESSFIPEGDDATVLEWLMSNFRVSPVYGTLSEHVNSLKPETRYSVLAFGAVGGVATTDLFRHDFYTEAEGECTNSVVEIRYGGPYSAAELADVDPEKYGDVAMYDDYGYYLMWAEIESKTSTTDVFFYHYDLSEVAQMGVDGIVNDLLTYYPSPSVQMLAGRNDVQFMLCGVAMDERGNVSELWMSDPFSFNLADKRPAEEFLAKFAERDYFTTLLGVGSSPRSMVVAEPRGERNQRLFQER